MKLKMKKIAAIVLSSTMLMGMALTVNAACNHSYHVYSAYHHPSCSCVDYEYRCENCGACYTQSFKCSAHL